MDPDQLAQAEARLQAVLLEDPRNFSALYAYGLLCHQIGREELAKKLLSAACDVEPSSWQAYAKLGLIHAKDGDLDSALACLNIALSKQPDNQQILLDIGKVLENKGLHDDATFFYERAVQSDSSDAEAWFCIANVMTKAAEGCRQFDPRRMDQILRAAKKAARIMPEAKHYNLIGNVYSRFCRPRAIEAYARAIELMPRNPSAYGGMANASRQLGAIERAVELYDKAVTVGAVGAASDALATLHYSDAFSNASFLAKAIEVGSAFQTGCDAPPFGRDRECKGPLRVGYVSGDFCSHPVAYFLLSVLRNHREAIEVHCFDTNPRPDEVTEALRRQPSSWHDIHLMDDAAAVDFIRQLGIDILVDLSGHTAGSRLGIFARRAAPVQVSWLGFFGTTGVQAMDAVFADATVVPEDESRFFVEKVVHLPDSYLCFSPPEFDTPIEPAPPMARGNPPTFGSLNSRVKLSARCIEVWSRVLTRVPESRLLLKGIHYLDLELCNDVARQFDAHGVNPSRLIMEPSTPRQDALKTYNRIDVALDTFPFGGGTTTAETLWMGVPVVALHGDRWVGRVSESMLTSVGLARLVAANEDEFCDLAVRTLSDPGQLTAWRQTLRAQMAASPLCDGAKFTHALESAYHALWQERCGRAGAEPRTCG